MREFVPLDAYGVKVNDPTAAGFNQPLIVKALAECHGRALLWPNGRVHHADQLTVDGLTLQGMGPLSEAYCQDGTTTPRGVVWLTGTSPAIVDMKVTRNATARSSNMSMHGVVVYNATDFEVTRLGVTDVAGAGLFVSRSLRGVVGSVEITRPRADSIHITGGARQITVDGAKITDSGDDMVAVVSYEKDNEYCEGIVVSNVVGERGIGRAFTVVGGRDITYRNCRAKSLQKFGLYVSSEWSYHTLGVDGVLYDRVLIDGTGVNDPSPGYWDGIRVLGRDRVVEGIPLLGDDFLVRNVRFRNCRIDNAGRHGALVDVGYAPSVVNEGTTFGTSGSGLGWVNQ